MGNTYEPRRALLPGEVMPPRPIRWVGQPPTLPPIPSGPVTRSPYEVFRANRPAGTLEGHAS